MGVSTRPHSNDRSRLSLLFGSDRLSERRLLSIAMPLAPHTLLLLLTSTSALKWSTIDAGTTGCHGTTYTPKSNYGAAASRWGHVPRGGWRGAVAAGDKIYGISTNATSVTPPLAQRPTHPPRAGPSTEESTWLAITGRCSRSIR